VNIDVIENGILFCPMCGGSLERNLINGRLSCFAHGDFKVMIKEDENVDVSFELMPRVYRDVQKNEISIHIKEKNSIPYISNRIGIPVKELMGIYDRAKRNGTSCIVKMKEHSTEWQ
jgi:hypothetical protein